MACQVFTACSAINRHNQQVALYILPHVVLHVLLDGTLDDATEVGLLSVFILFGKFYLETEDMPEILYYGKDVLIGKNRWSQLKYYWIGLGKIITYLDYFLLSPTEVGRKCAFVTDISSVLFFFSSHFCFLWSSLIFLELPHVDCVADNVSVSRCRS